MQLRDRLLGVEANSHREQTGVRIPELGALEDVVFPINQPSGDRIDDTQCIRAGQSENERAIAHRRLFKCVRVMLEAGRESR